VDNGRRRRSISGIVVGMDVLLGHHEFSLGIERVRAAVLQLDETERRAARDVDRLLDGGWTGAAASAFAAAWEDWLAGAADVRVALGSIAESLVVVRRELDLADLGSVAATDRIRERLG
jgi:WXG100 family type VII secretion target